MGEVYFVSGTGTGVGKTYATGFLARKWGKKNRVITQKLIETGCPPGQSADVTLHRKIMGIAPTIFDHEGVTHPLVYPLAASPHLASEAVSETVDLAKIHAATVCLQKNFDVVLVEGAGGLMVPLRRDYLTLDYIKDHAYPVILVVAGALGELNAALLSLEILKSRALSLFALVFNRGIGSDQRILADNCAYLKNYLITYPGQPRFIELPAFTEESFNFIG